MDTFGIGHSTFQIENNQEKIFVFLVPVKCPYCFIGGLPDVIPGPRHKCCSFGAGRRSCLLQDSVSGCSF